MGNSKPNIPCFHSYSTMAISYKNAWLCIATKGELAY